MEEQDVKEMWRLLKKFFDFQVASSPSVKQSDGKESRVVQLVVTEPVTGEFVVYTPYGPIATIMRNRLGFMEPPVMLPLDEDFTVPPKEGMH